jgi:HSP20 family protein
MDSDDVSASLTDLRLRLGHWLAPWLGRADHALDGLGRALGAVEVFGGPPLDYSQTAAQAEYLFEVPGYAAEDLAVTVSGEVLTLTGRRPVASGSAAKIHRAPEPRRRPFVRSAPLPSGADIEAIEATLKAGVLRIVVPRTLAGSARAIPIRVAPSTGRS